MKILKNRIFAVAVSVVLVLCSTLFSVHRTLGAKCQKIEDGFYTGVTYDGYLHKSISSQLNVCSNAANGLVTVADNYSSLSGAANDLRESRYEYLDAADECDIDDMYEANEDLKRSFSALADAMSGLELSDKERSAYDDYVSTFRGAQSVIESSGYNDSVREFRRGTLNVFPTNILGSIAGVDKPELFD